MILIKLILYFIVVIGVLYLAYRVTRFIGERSQGGQLSGSLKVLERVSVGRDSSLMIVEVQGRYLLLGVTPGGIVKLEELDEYQASGADMKIPEFGDIFAGKLKEVLKKNDGKNGRGTGL